MVRWVPRSEYGWGAPIPGKQGWVWPEIASFECAAKPIGAPWRRRRGDSDRGNGAPPVRRNSPEPARPVLADGPGDCTARLAPTNPVARLGFDRRACTDQAGAGSNHAGHHETVCAAAHER